MKKLILVALIVGAFSTQFVSAQVKVDINISTQPIWGPTGYDHADYYYLPEYDVYYDVPHHRYVYSDGGKWVFAAALPARFHNVDLYHTYKVVLNEPRPYLHHDEHVRKYAEFKTRRDQAVIRDSHEEKYWQIKDHPEHSKWHVKDHRDRHS